MNKSMEIILTTLSPLFSLNYSSTTVSTSSLTSPSSSTSSPSLSQMNENISEINNNNNNTNNTIIGKHFENVSDHLSHNYSFLISKLEKLAFDSVLSSTSTPNIENIFKNTPDSNNIEQQHLLQQKLYQQQEKHNFLNQLQYQTQQQLLKYSGGTGDNVRIINDIYGNNNNNYNLQSSSDIITEDTNNVVHTMSDAEYSRFISDIWIGIVLTLLILSIVFFICSCFLYHKFQQWKNSYRSNNSEPEIVRRYDIDVESLPSYTLVSGLPTYDDAIEQFRKAGIIIQQPSVIKMFEDHLSAQTKIPLHGSGIILHDELSNNDTNNSSICIRNQNDNNNASLTLNSNSFIGNNVANNNNNGVSNNNNNNNYCRNDTNTSNNNDSNQQQFDNISLNSMCSCGNIMNNGNTNNMMMNISNSSSNVSNNNNNLTTMTNITDGGDTSSSSSIPQSSSAATLTSNLTGSVIELSPEQLRMLSQKRFSLQIALTNNNSNPNNTNNNGNNNGYMNAIAPTPRIRLSSLSITPARRGKVDLFREISRNNLLRSHDIPQIHHSTSSLNCCTNINNNERSFLAKRLMRNLQHRGSLS